MKDIGRLLLRHRTVSGVFGLFIVAYLLQIFLIPVNSAALQKYHLTELQYHETLLAIALPYIAIWIIALVGFLRLRTYVITLGASKDGQAFQLICKGVYWFTLWLPLSTVISTLGGYAYRDHADFTANIVRLEVYANLLLLVPAFIYVYQGSVRLLQTARIKLSNPTFRTTIGFIVFSALYTFVVLEDSARRVAVDSNTPATYYLPDWLTITTVIIPRLLLWYLGVLAVQNIILYRQKVSGVIYKKALKSLATGIGGVTVLIIVLRCIQSLGNTLSKMSLGALLLIIFVLLIMMAGGYILIAKGAKQLQSIEEA